MIDHHKLFRAIVIMGAALTASCDDERCHRCVPIDAPASDSVATNDAQPADAPVDAVLIL